MFLCTTHFQTEENAINTLPINAHYRIPLQLRLHLLAGETYSNYKRIKYFHVPTFTAAAFACLSHFFLDVCPSVDAVEGDT